jgi:hypothetical protein
MRREATEYRRGEVSSGLYLSSSATPPGRHDVAVTPSDATVDDLTSTQTPTLCSSLFQKSDSFTLCTGLRGDSLRRDALLSTGRSGVRGSGF